MSNIALRTVIADRQEDPRSKIENMLNRLGIAALHT